MRIKLLILALFLRSGFLFCQTPKLDSLKLMLLSSKDDSMSCRILDKMIEQEEDEQIWGNYNERLRKICESHLHHLKPGEPTYRFYTEYLGRSLNNSGYLANVNGQVNKALFYFNRCLKVQQCIDDREGMASTLNNIGVIYNTIGDIPNALDHYHRAMKILEQMDDKKSLAYALHNIGFIFKSQKNYAKALEYYQKGFKLWEETQDKEGMAHSLNNIGSLLREQKQYDKAFEHYSKSLEHYNSIQNKHGIALVTHNIGELYECTGKHHEALIQYEKSLALSENIHDLKSIANSLVAIAELKYDKNDLPGAETYATRSLRISENIMDLLAMTNATALLHKLFSKKGNYKEAYRMHVLHKKLSDSLSNENNRRSSIQKELQYVYEKKAASDSLMIAEERKLAKASLVASEALVEEERTKKRALYGGIGLVMIFTFFIYNRFRVTKQQKRIIELKEAETQKQKHIIEEKQKEILDSIKYAQRIQKAHLPGNSLLTKQLKRSGK